MSNTVSKSWCFTINNKEDGEFLRELFRDGVSRWVAQAESAPTTGTKHLQGYVLFEKAKRFNAVRKMLEGAHIEKAKGNPSQNYKYCTKVEGRLAGPWEEWPESEQGKRTDLDEVKNMIVEGKSDKDIADQYFGDWCRYRKSFMAYRSLLQEPRSAPMDVRIFWGDAGSGKTRFAYDNFATVYPLPQPNHGSGAIWFDGYHGQECILIDDFYGWLPLSFMLKLLDRYPMQLQVKGGSTQFLASTTTIIITSNVNWEQWYEWKSDELKAAFKRRITEIKHFIRI